MIVVCIVRVKCVLLHVKGLQKGRRGFHWDIYKFLKKDVNIPGVVHPQQCFQLDKPTFLTHQHIFSALNKGL